MKPSSRLVLTTIVLMILLLSTYSTSAHAFTNGQRASLVIGQSSFLTSRSATTQSGLSAGNEPRFDSSGNMWVADFGNNRILEFKPPFTNGMNASLVIGQAGFNTNKIPPQPTQRSLYGGQGDAAYLQVGFGPSGDLWVGDCGNNRVVAFKAPFSTGMDAAVVIGQPNFTASAALTTQNGLSCPESSFDSSGNLWVGDIGNNRVLEFSSTPVPEFPTASLAIIALLSLAVVAVVTRRFSVKRPDG